MNTLAAILSPLVLSSALAFTETPRVDLCVYGATPSGIVAAVGHRNGAIIPVFGMESVCGLDVNQYRVEVKPVGARFDNLQLAHTGMKPAIDRKL